MLVYQRVNPATINPSPEFGHLCKSLQTLPFPSQTLAGAPFEPPWQGEGALHSGSSSPVISQILGWSPSRNRITAFL